MTARAATTFDKERPRALAQDAVAAVTAWWEEEERHGTLVDTETLWREAYLRYVSIRPALAEADAGAVWAALVSQIVFDSPKVPRNERDAAAQAAVLLQGASPRPLTDDARALHQIAARAVVEPSKLLGLLGPGVAYPWTFPRSLWNPEVLGSSLHALLADLAWEPGREPEPSGMADSALRTGLAGFLDDLRRRAPDGSELGRLLGAIESMTAGMEQEGKDICVVEPQAFVEALARHGLDQGDLERFRAPLSMLREAVVLVESCRLYFDAERSVTESNRGRDENPDEALAFARRAANIYKRLGVAQMYPERLLERHQQLSRQIEEIRPEASEAAAGARRFDHVLLVSTFNSPPDLQRLLLSVAHEQMGFGYGRLVHVIVSDDSSPDMRERNRSVIDDLVRAGMSISHWDIDRKGEFLDQLNREIFPGGSFDVRDLAGLRKPGEKGVPYGRFRNFLRLVALKEVREMGLDEPLLTWLDQDNELGALVLTKGGKLSKRHVFNYFDQKSQLFADGELVVGGGGYTNDALEGVEKFWVAWGILHRALEVARDHDPDGPPLLPAEPDITRFRPWDQSDTLERLPREGETVSTLADQVVLLLTTLLGTFRGKYDNQVQVYHPWTSGYVAPKDERLVEESRPFAGMPGGNTTFATEALRSPTPFITVGGRGEDILHLWQLEASHGVGSVALTHTPALHTRNVGAGRSDLMTEIIDSYNGRILREPPLFWGALSRMLSGEAPRGVDAEAMAGSAEHVENLRGEAKARIAEVSAFAAALAPYLEEGSDFWWVQRARDDARFGDLLAEIRQVVARFTDVDRYQAQADAKLLTIEDVRDLTDEFVSAYPHWETVVAHVSGVGTGSGEAARGAASVAPFPGYGAFRRDAEHRRPAEVERAGIVQPPASGEPTGDSAWHEVVSASLALFRRYETGRAQADQFVDWPQRVDRLREIYRHYVSLVGEMPEFVWAILVRDALLIPFSAQYAALTELLSEEFWQLDAAGRDERVSRVAADLGVDEDLLRLAVEAPVEAAAS